MRVEATIGRYLNLCYDLENGWETLSRFENQVRATRKTRITAYEMHQEGIYKWLNKCTRFQESGLSFVSLSLISGFAFFLVDKLKHDEERVTSFLKELLVDGAAKNGTLLLVRKKLIRNKMKTDIIPRHDEMRYIIRAWNDYILGKQVSTIRTYEDAFKYIRPL